MFNHNLNFLRDCKISVVEREAAAGTSTLTTDILDMSGYDSVIFIAILGDVTDTSALALKVLGNATNDTVTPTEYAGNASGTASATSADGKMLAVDCQKPRDRYVYATLARATANAVVNAIIAIQYNSHERGNTDANLDSWFFDWAEQNDPAAA